MSSPTDVPGRTATSAVVLTAAREGLMAGDITYLVGDATAPVGEGREIVAHIVNDRGRWGKGFVLVVSRR